MAAKRMARRMAWQLLSHRKMNASNKREGVTLRRRGGGSNVMMAASRRNANDEITIA